MPAIFNALPGIEVPVRGIARGLADMWVDAAARGSAAPGADDVTATQVNFVLHLGSRCTPEDAQRQFETTVRFSRRYPSRVVVLCPRFNETGDPEMRAKVYGECFLGKSKSDKRCVEFVLLSYPMSARPYLESQVSTCLSVDLPLFYWAHGFSTSSRLADYRYLLSRARRVLIDSGVSPDDALTYPWPNPNSLRDLVYSRLLPVRQTVGQFLARYEMPRLTEGLKAVHVSHGPEMAAEGRVILGWLRRRLSECGPTGGGMNWKLDAGKAHELAIDFIYSGGAKTFRWRGDLATKHAVFEADFGRGKTNLAAAASLLSPEAALSEAMFF